MEGPIKQILYISKSIVSQENCVKNVTLTPQIVWSYFLPCGD